MKRLFVLAILLTAPISWVAEFKYVDFDKGFICNSENNRYVILIETYLWLDVPDKVWISYDADFSQVHRVKVDINENHISWKHNDFFSPATLQTAGIKSTLNHQLDLINLEITSTNVDTAEQHQILYCDLKSKKDFSELVASQSRD